MFPNQFMSGNGHGFPNNQSQGFMNSNSMLNGHMMNMNTMQQQQQQSSNMGMMNNYGNNMTDTSYSNGNSNNGNMDEMREAQQQEEAFSRAQLNIPQKQQELISQTGENVQTGQLSTGNISMEEEKTCKNVSKENEQEDNPSQDKSFVPGMLPLELEMYGTPEQKERFLAAMQYQQEIEEDEDSTSMPSQMMSQQQNLQQNIPFSQMMMMNQEQTQVMNNQVVQMGNFNNGGQVLGGTYIGPAQPTIVSGNGVWDMNRNNNNFGNEMNSVPTHNIPLSTGNASIVIPGSSNIFMQGYTLPGNTMMSDNGISPAMNMNLPSYQTGILTGQFEGGAAGSIKIPSLSALAPSYNPYAVDAIPSLSALAPSYNPYAVDTGINSVDDNMMGSDDVQNDTSSLLDQTLQQSNGNEQNDNMMGSDDVQNDTSSLLDQTLQQSHGNEQNDTPALPDQTLLQQSHINEQNDTSALPDQTLLQQSHVKDQNENDEDWMEKFHLLKRYKMFNGDFNMPSDYHDDNGINLGRFVQKQKELCRVFYSNGCDEQCGLTKFQCKLLESIGLVETKIPGSLWLKRYKDLEIFQEKHGHCNVPKAIDKSLANFVRNQRQLYRKYTIGTPSPMTEEKIRLLERIGFTWKNVSLIENPDKGEHGDDFIPEDTNETYLQYEKDSQDSINGNEENVAKRSDENRIGIKLVDKRQGFNGLSRASKDLLSVDYAPQIIVDGRKISHILFSKTPHIFNVEGDNSEFYVHEEEYVQSQSSEYDDEADSEDNDVEADSEDNDDEADYEDNVLSEYSSNDGEESEYDTILQKIARERGSFGNSYNTNRQFIRRFQELIKFKKKFGHVQVTKMPGRSSLACWISTQRAKHRKYVQGEASTLTGLRIAALVKIGVTFPNSHVTRDELEEIVEKELPKRGERGRYLVSRDTAWNLRFQELLEYKMKHGNCLVREGSQALINWTKCQRQRYKEYTKSGCRAITDIQVQRMNEIGFSWNTPCNTKQEEKTKLESEGLEAFDILDDELIYRVLGFIVDDINAIISFFSTSNRFVCMMNNPRSSDSLFRECYVSSYGIHQLWKMSQSKTYNESSWLDILREGTTFEDALNLLRDIDDGQVHVDDIGADSESYVRNEDGLGILSRKDEYTSLISENMNLTPKGTSDSWSKGYSGLEVFTVEGKEGESSDVFFAIFGDFNGVRIIKSMNSLLPDERSFHHEFKSVGMKRFGKVTCALSVPKMSFTNSSQNSNPRLPVLIVGTEAGGIASIFPVKNKGTVDQYGIVSMNHTHESEVTCLSLLPTSRMKHDALDMLISTGSDGKAFVYPHSFSSHPYDFELHNCALCIKHNAPITSLIPTIVDNTILLVTGDKNGRVALWRAKNPSSFADGVDFEFEKISKATSAFGSKVFVEKICLLNDRTIASGSSRGDIFVWHIQEKNSKRSDRQYKLEKTWTIRNAHSSKITSMTCYADILLTTGKGDDTTIAWSSSGVEIARIKNGANLTMEDVLSQPNLSKVERQVYSYKGLQSSIVCNLVCDNSLLSLSRDGTICRWYYRDLLEQEILKSQLQSTEKRKIRQDQGDNKKRVKMDQAVEHESIGCINEHSNNDIDSDSNESDDDFGEDDVHSESSDEEDIESDNDFDWQ